MNSLLEQHFLDPQNIGEIDSPTHKIERKNPVCGDQIIMTLKIENQKILDVKFMSYGCSSFIAASSIFTEMIKNKNLYEIKKINKKDLEKEIGSLTTYELHVLDILEDIKGELNGF